MFEQHTAIQHRSQPFTLQSNNHALFSESIGRVVSTCTWIDSLIHAVSHSGEDGFDMQEKRA